MPIIIKKMQMNVNQTRNTGFMPVARSFNPSSNMLMQKNGSGLYTPMVDRISGAKSGCGCGK